MRVVVTGGNGFIGAAVVRRLVGRGDTVVAIVRDPDAAPGLAALGGVELRRGDLSRTMAIVDAMRGADAVIHIAGSYRVGITPDERPAMLDGNVGTTNRVLDAAATANLERIVYTSTVNVFGNTHGRIVDERYRRDVTDGFLTYYDETKFLAHRVAEERIAGGAPIVIVQPGFVYGPGDHSAAGAQLKGAVDGSLHYRVLEETGVSLVFVEDLASGFLAALDRGRIGESYVMAGENTRLGDALAVAARVGGHPLPRLTFPTSVLRVLSKAPASLARAAGMPPNLQEVFDSAAGVTYWASSAKAAAELGYTARDLASGVRAAFGRPGG